MVASLLLMLGIWTFDADVGGEALGPESLKCRGFCHAFLVVLGFCRGAVAGSGSAAETVVMVCLKREQSRIVCDGRLSTVESLVRHSGHPGSFLFGHWGS